ncbi:MAG: hypothetical protein J6M65_11095 [Eubacterium sp.]|nr:hypothetical protein [Eubacterium sp.]
MENNTYYSKDSDSHGVDNISSGFDENKMICMQTLLLMMNIAQGDFIINVFLGEDGDPNE